MQKEIGDQLAKLILAGKVLDGSEVAVDATLGDEGLTLTPVATGHSEDDAVPVTLTSADDEVIDADVLDEE